MLTGFGRAVKRTGTNPWQKKVLSGIVFRLYNRISGTSYGISEAENGSLCHYALFIQKLEKDTENRSYGTPEYDLSMVR